MIYCESLEAFASVLLGNCQVCLVLMKLYSKCRDKVQRFPTRAVGAWGDPWCIKIAFTHADCWDQQTNMAAVGDEVPLQDPGKKTAAGGQDLDVSLQEPARTQHDHLITEIESADGHLGSTLR